MLRTPIVVPSSVIDELSTAKPGGIIDDGRSAFCMAMLPTWKTPPSNQPIESTMSQSPGCTPIDSDDTTVPVMPGSRTDIARLLVYMRDDRPYGGADPPAALFHYSRDRRGEHPQAHLASWSGILQSDANAGYNELYGPIRQPGPILEAGCFAHARRKFFVLAAVTAAAHKKNRGEQAGTIYPIALEAVEKIDALFDIARAINVKSPAERAALRQQLSAPLMAQLHAWLEEHFAKLSRSHDLTKAINYMLRRWAAFSRFLDDGRVCSSNNAAERALRCVPLGRKAWLSAAPTAPPRSIR